MTASSINRDSYNRIAGEWSRIRDGQFVSRLVRDFAACLPQEGHVLDLGCGTGNPNTRFLSENGFTVTGIDASEKMIAIAKKQQFARASFLTADFFSFHPNTRFDGILAWDSLFHFPKTAQENIYPKLAQWLRPGGLLLFTHGKNEDEHNDQMFGETFYYSSLAKEKLFAVLAETGFLLTSVHEDFNERETHRDLVVLAALSAARK